MCDTQVLRAENGVWFAKNSDREPHEPQAIVRYPPVHADPNPTLRTTYLEIPQVADRFGLILSQPSWLWGAEMGVNDQGLAIGNEAIFSRQRSLKPALLGMDLLRLALERAASAPQAIEVITTLLEQHGQGGPAGFAERGFHYDSSFIIADAQQAWVLETAGRDWAARPVRDYAAISNGLSIATDYTRKAPGVHGAFRANDTRFLPYFAASRQRRALSLECLQRAASASAPEFATFARHLRAHRRGNEAPLRGSNADICMHATGPIRRSQTTGSMIVWLGPQGIRTLVTATSAPCLSLFRPVSFDQASHLLARTPAHAPLWQAWQAVQRAALFDTDYRQRLRAVIADAENTLLQAWMGAEPDFAALDALAEQTSTRILGWPRPAPPRAWSSARRLWR